MHSTTSNLQTTKRWLELLPTITRLPFIPKAPYSQLLLHLWLRGWQSKAWTLMLTQAIWINPEALPTHKFRDCWLTIWKQWPLAWMFKWNISFHARRQMFSTRENAARLMRVIRFKSCQETNLITFLLALLRARNALLQIFKIQFTSRLLWYGPIWSSNIDVDASLAASLTTVWLSLLSMRDGKLSSNLKIL